jgi:hypothetical protein
LRLRHILAYSSSTTQCLWVSTSVNLEMTSSSPIDPLHLLFFFRPFCLTVIIVRSPQITRIPGRQLMTHQRHARNQRKASLEDLQYLFIIESSRSLETLGRLGQRCEGYFCDLEVLFHVALRSLATQMIQLKRESVCATQRGPGLMRCTVQYNKTDINETQICPSISIILKPIRKII